MKKIVNGELVEMPLEEQEELMGEKDRREIDDATRPLTLEEVQTLTIRKQVNSLNIDNQTASRMVDFFPAMAYGGAAVEAGTRINWKGQLKRAAVTLWDRDDNDPDHAPSLWEDIDYKDGIRIAPETFTATNAAAMDELMWFGEHIYRSGMAGNVYTPEQAPGVWEIVR